ncbi:MAG TPA: cadherin repeat domain-containing protein, partial [Allocoleopsis sp.]
SPNFEVKNSYSVRIRTTDAGGLFFEKSLTIGITNLNEAPTDLALDNSTINENVAAGTAVGKFSTTDPDANNTFIYALVTGSGSTDNGLFTIVGNELRINSIPNFEVKPNYSIRVQSTDQNGLSVQKQLTIAVANLNEAPTGLAISKDNINENAPANSVIGTFLATDPDANSTFTYELIAGTGGADNAAFTIVNNELRINSSPDFETKSSYSILVRAKDQAGLFFDKAFIIKINDLVDPPTNQAPTNVSLSPAGVNENVAAGTAVGIFSTTDANSGDTFTYTLVTGTGDTDNAAFTIVNNELRIVNSPNFETKGTYSIRVRTTDQGGLTFEKALTITVNDLNEAPTDILLTPSAVNENVAPGT